MVKETIAAIREDIVLLSIGAVCFSFSVFSNILAEFSIFVLMVGLAFMALSTYDVCRITSKRNTLKGLVEDKKGLVWIWIVGLFITIPVCAFFYWILDYPFDIISAQMATLYTFTGVLADAWVATQFVVSYLLAFVLVMAILWVIINAKSPGVIY